MRRSTANTHDDSRRHSNGPTLDAPVATVFESCIIFSRLCFGLILCYCAKWLLHPSQSSLLIPKPNPVLDNWKQSRMGCFFAILGQEMFIPCAPAQLQQINFKARALNMSESCSTPLLILNLQHVWYFIQSYLSAAVVVPPIILTQ